jgi:hypothetical protein
MKVEWRRRVAIFLSERTPAWARSCDVLIAPKCAFYFVNIYAFEESFAGRCREILKGLNIGSFEIICVINWVNKRSGIIIWVTEGPPFLGSRFRPFCLKRTPA